MNNPLPDTRFGEAFDRFLEFETELKLANLLVDGVPVWRLVRGQVFDHWLEIQGIQDRNESGRMALSEQMIGAAKRIVGDFSSRRGIHAIALAMYGVFEKGVNKSLGFIVQTFTSPIEKVTSANALVAGFIRLLPGQVRLTDPLEKRLQGNMMLIDKAHAGPMRRVRIDPSTIDREIRKQQNSIDMAKIQSIAKKIADALDFDQQYVASLMALKSIEYLNQEAFFDHLFSKGRIQVVYLAWNKYYFGLLAAAKRHNIPTVEFQHGIIGPYHIQYAWPHKTRPPAYPDTFLHPGEAWAGIGNLAPDTISIDIGSHHMDEMIARYGNTSKATGLVAVFSQRIIGVRLFRFVVEVARLCPDMTFEIKLHPTERYQNLKSYVQGSIPDNLSIAPKHENSYALMARSEFQIGVSSTTLVEALKFGTKTIVVPLPSWEYMKTWLDDGSMQLASSPQLAAELLKSNMTVRESTDRWYGPSKPDRIPVPSLDG